MNNNRTLMTMLAGVSIVLLIVVFFFLRTGAGLRASEVIPGSGMSEGAAKRSATMITTHAVAHRTIDNTAVDISVGITASEHDQSATQRILAQKSTTLTAFLKARQVEHLITTGVSFTPDTREHHNGPTQTVAYDGALTMSFRTTPEKAAEVLSGVLTNGANNISSTVFAPTEEEVVAARRDLVAEATRTAVEQAQSIAKAAGTHMVTVLSINVQDVGAASTVAPAMEDLRSEKSVATPTIQTAAGDQEISVGVDVISAAAHD